MISTVARKKMRKQAKFYLSEEAIELLREESERSTYSMSTIVDMLAKQHLGGTPPVVDGARPPEPPVDTKQETESKVQHDDEFYG